MRFSLVLATVDRVRELERFLRSLDAQTHRDFELIIVDQNPDDRLELVLKEYRARFRLVHLHSQRGLSRARNVGLKQLAGDIVAFPDDDCWYPSDLLEKAAAFWEKHPDWDGSLGKLIWEEAYVEEALPASVRSVNIFNATTSVDAVSLLQALTPRKLPVSASSVTLLLKREAVKTVNGFDEELGLGSGTKWGGGDDIDMIVRCLKSGFRICHNPALKVHHPDSRQGYVDPHRGFRYGAGMGRVLRKHRYPTWFAVYHVLRSLGGAGLDLIHGKVGDARYHWAVSCGKLAGWRSIA